MAAATTAAEEVQTPWLRIEEAARRYRCSRAFIYSLARDKRICIHKLAGRSLIDAREVDALLLAPAVAAEWR